MLCNIYEFVFGLCIFGFSIIFLSMLLIILIRTIQYFRNKKK